MPLTYSNPRMLAVIDNWPSGKHRTTATFKIEFDPSRGERATRTTIDPKTGKPSAPKVMTFARKARIVDGSDGKTYIIELSSYDFISVMQSNMKFQADDPIWPTNERYAAIRALFGMPQEESGNV